MTLTNETVLSNIVPSTDSARSVVYIELLNVDMKYIHDLFILVKTVYYVIILSPKAPEEKNTM